MSWIPNDSQKLQLENAIKMRFRQSDEKEKTRVYNLLLGASGKKQADAVLENCTIDEIQLLYSAGFNLDNNSPNTIRVAVANAPTVIAANKQAAIAKKAVDAKQANINNEIDGYLGSVSGKYKKHMAGEEVTIPVEDMDGNKLVVFARYFGNMEGYLPNAGGYVEWYAKVGSSRSMDKRFFTRKGVGSIWYTVGGTHANVATPAWFKRTAGSKDWVQIWP